jgi:ribosomal protein L19E
LESEKVEVVREAEKGLTREQQQQILKRKDIEIRAHQDETESSRGEGPSKGKMPDPRNWGGVDLSDPELDPEAQRKALKAWNEAKAWSNTDTGEGLEVTPSSAESDTETQSEPSVKPLRSSRSDEAKRLARYERKLRRKLRKLHERKELAAETQRDMESKLTEPNRQKAPMVSKPKHTSRREGNPVVGMIDKALKQAQGEAPR